MDYNGQPKYDWEKPCPIGWDTVTCFCEDHCSWRLCRLHQPPEKCLADRHSEWVWDAQNMYWVAQKKGYF